MSAIKPLDVGFNYTQDVPSSDVTQTFLSTHTTLRERLKNMYVFVHEHDNKTYWFTTPMHISKKEKKTLFSLRKKNTIMVEAKEIFLVTPKPITYDMFKHNIHTIMRKVENQELLWVNDKNEAIIQANILSQTLQQLAVEAPEYQSYKVDIKPLYEVLNTIVPSISEYIKELERE